MHPRTTQPDVFIAGAGPAGLACAIAVALQGLTVHVADGMEPPIDKACGEGLLPNTLAALAQLGVSPSAILGHPIRGIRFLESDSANPRIAAQAVFPSSPGLGVKRADLHTLLLDRALALGVDFTWRTVVQSVEGGLVRTNRISIRPRYFIGADGHRSRVAMLAGLDKGTTYSRRIGLRQHYAIAPWSRFVEIYWSNYGQAYVTPISPTEICIAFVAREKMGTPEQALRHFPALQRHLSTAQPSGSARGSITLGRSLDRVTKGNIALIGDASGSVDAITGEGLALAFRQAAALAHALETNNLALYQQAHRRIQRLPSLMSRSLLLMDRSPLVRNTVLNSFQRSPRLFERLLKIHVGHSPLQSFCTEGLHTLPG